MFVFGSREEYNAQLFEVFDVRNVDGVIFFLIYYKDSWKYVGASNFRPVNR